jgi:hypothetical protein
MTTARRLLTPFNIALAGIGLFLIATIATGMAGHNTASADVSIDRTSAAESGYFTTQTVASGDVPAGVKIVAAGPLFVPEEMANAESANAPIIWNSRITSRCFDFWVRVTDQGEPFDVMARPVDCKTGRPQ